MDWVKSIEKLDMLIFKKLSFLGLLFFKWKLRLCSKQVTLDIGGIYMDLECQSFNPSPAQAFYLNAWSDRWTVAGQKQAVIESL